MQRTMTEIPVVRKLSSNKLFSVSKQPCKYRAYSGNYLIPIVKYNNNSPIWRFKYMWTWPLQIVKTSLNQGFHRGQSVSTFCLYWHAHGSLAAHPPGQQDGGTLSPQSVKLLTPQQSSWNKLFREQKTISYNMLMKDLSHPGRGNSKCCIIKQLDVFQFLEDISSLIQEASSAETGREFQAFELSH